MMLKIHPDIMKPAENPYGQGHKFSMAQKALNGTFYCERFHCRLLPESCVQRQKSWDPEIYQGCLGCKQGLEIAREAGVKIKCGSSKRSSPWKTFLQHRKKRKNERPYQKIQENLEGFSVRELTAS